MNTTVRILMCRVCFLYVMMSLTFGATTVWAEETEEMTDLEKFGSACSAAEGTLEVDVHVSEGFSIVICKFGEGENAGGMACAFESDGSQSVDEDGNDICLSYRDAVWELPPRGGIGGHTHGWSEGLSEFMVLLEEVEESPNSDMRNDDSSETDASDGEGVGERDGSEGLGDTPLASAGAGVCGMTGIVPMLLGLWCVSPRWMKTDLARRHEG